MSVSSCEASLSRAGDVARRLAGVKRWKIVPSLAYKFVRDNRALCERNCRERNVDP